MMKPYSTLDPAGDIAVIIAEMSWWLFGIAAVIWILFILLQYLAVVKNPKPQHHAKLKRYVVIGGTLFSVIVITISVYFSLLPYPKILKDAPTGSLTVTVNGLQWWWRVLYHSGEAQIELANEIWLPVNEPVQFLLKSEDVIHSFWIPSLAGKMDMIPGRVNKLSLTPTKVGEYMGICAEYCGGSHALMRLNVKVVERDKFDDWLNGQKENAKKASDEMSKKGQEAFIANGCISCHTVRGVSSLSNVGPDLTHIGSRMRIGSGILDNNVHHMKRWIENAGKIKPEVKMPNFDMIDEEDRQSMAHWLEGLK